MAGLDIAIVGLACRLPGGVEDLSGVWDALRADTDQLRVGPGSRRVGELGVISARGGWLADACWTRFDHRRFRISPAEARSLEPRQRLLLKLCWEALEASLQAPLAQEGSRSGVFLGTGPSDWGREAYAAGVELDPFTGTGHFASVAAGRIAYTLGLVGPALSVQTACSSGLVALHLACRELASGRVGQAIVGAVNGLMATEPTRYFARLGALSPSGRSHPFDRSADGYVRAEGGVVLILRPREEALALGLPVLGVIRGTAVNQDGRSNGLTAPSGRAQEDVLRAALADASVSPAEVAHIEAHGTGTPLGDPIELRALDSVFGVNAPTIHAAKARFGHLECAAGLVGVVSALSALEHRVAPAVLGLETTNPRAGQLRIKLPRSPEPLGSGLVGVSSFGLSGTNAHVLIESGQPRAERPEPAPGPRLASGWAPETVRIVPDDPESALTSRVATSHGPWRRVDDGDLVHALRRPEPVLVIGSGADVAPVLEWLRAHGVEPERAIAVDDAPSVAIADCVRTSMGQLEHVLQDEGERDTVWPRCRGCPSPRSPGFHCTQSRPMGCTRAGRSTGSSRHRADPRCSRKTPPSVVVRGWSWTLEERSTHVSLMQRLV